MQFAVRTTHGFCPPLDSAHSTPFDQQLRPDPDHRSTAVVAASIHPVFSLLFTSQLHCQSLSSTSSIYDNGRQALSLVCKAEAVHRLV